MMDVHPTQLGSLPTSPTDRMPTVLTRRGATGAAMRATCLVCVAAVVALALPVHAQALDTEDARWDAYESAQTEYDAAVIECEDRGATTTSGDRACRQAAVAGARLVDALGVLLEDEDDLFGEDREVAIDAWLTYQQHVGTLLTDVGECRHGAEVLRTLADEPALRTRPLLVEATDSALAEAEACVAAQTAADTPAPVAAVRPWGWATAGAGAAIAVTGIAIAAGPFAAANEDVRCWNAVDCDPGLTEAEIGAVVDRRTRLNRAATSLLGIGSAAVVGGVSWALIERRRSSDTTLSAWGDFDGGGLLFTTKF